VGSRQSAVGGRQSAFNARIARPSICKSANLQICKSRPSAFTLVELLVTISIIGIMAALTMGVVHSARQMSAEAATKATIAKLNAIIMKRYEGYRNRRVPVSLSTDTRGKALSRAQIAEDRLYAIRDIMRMEMPDRLSDITAGPIQLKNSGGSVTQPALNKLYNSRVSTDWPMDANAPANAYLLYQIVSMGSPGAMEQFSQSEIGYDPTYDPNHKWPYFVDGWGRPIYFLRWAPGCSANHTTGGVADGYSDIQSGDPTKDHDPFDPQRSDTAAYHLIPLIYSDGATASDPSHGINIGGGYNFANTSGDMFNNDDFLKIGSLLNMTSYGGITNHHIEMR
jgi:prepilin-type N-terminal cleavage/methylation domain-containing protein